MAGIITRFKDIMSSNINALLDKAEDPSKMIDQYLRNLESDLGKVKAETASVMAEEKRAFYEPVFAREMAIGVVLCILSVIPIVIAGTMNAADYICAFCVGFLLLIIAVGVNRIIRVNMIKGSYDILLQEGEFSRKEKRLKKKTDVFTNAYWCLATAIYLGWSFWSERWDFTWILWVVAGVLYAALLGIVKVFVKKEE